MVSKGQSDIGLMCSIKLVPVVVYLVKDKLSSTLVHFRIPL